MHYVCVYIYIYLKKKKKKTLILKSSWFLVTCIGIPATVSFSDRKARFRTTNCAFSSFSCDEHTHTHESLYISTFHCQSAPFLTG